MKQEILATYFPILLYLTLHFGFLEKLSKRKYLLPSLLACFCLVIYTAIMYTLHMGWNKSNILTLLPTIHIFLAISLRYILFTQERKSDPSVLQKQYCDPEIIYPGVFTIYWNNKRHIPSPIEYIYSFGVLLLPWLVLIFI